MKHFLIAVALLFSISYADTLNSINKNPSMAINGTQRDSASVINPYVIPVAVSGAVCNSATDTVAVTSDHSSQLICQSGTNTWQTVGGGLGIGQAWYNVTGSRSMNTLYVNNTGKPILVAVSAWAFGGNTTSLYIDGGMVGYVGGGHIEQNWMYQISGIVKNGGTYYLTTTSGAIVNWAELR